MDRLEIEWRHLDVDGKTCDRCADTGTAVRAACEGLARELAPKGWIVGFTETRLTENEISDSNAILVNGIPMEELLPHGRRSESCCPSCREMLGAPVMCRTIEHRGRTHEAIPPELIREAVYEFVRQQSG